MISFLAKKEVSNNFDFYLANYLFVGLAQVCVYLPVLLPRNRLSLFVALSLERE